MYSQVIGFKNHEKHCCITLYFICLLMKAVSCPVEAVYYIHMYMYQVDDCLMNIQTISPFNIYGQETDTKDACKILNQNQKKSIMQSTKQNRRQTDGQNSQNL